MATPIILVVDADSNTHDDIAEVLSDEECILYGAASTSRALWLARRRSPSVVVVDADSVSNPVELVLQLQEIAPRLLALIATRDASAPGAASLAAAGAILQKPLDPVALRSAVRKSLKLAAMTTAAPGDGAVDGTSPTHAIWHRIATTRRQAD